MSPIRHSVLIGSCFMLTACGAATVTPPATPTSMSTNAYSTAIPLMSPSSVSLPSVTPSPTMNAQNPVITMQTSMGTVKIELFADKVPNTVANFVKLSKEKFYNGILFHRVIPGFMAQSGDPNTKDSDPYNDGMGGPGYKFADEFVSGLSNVRGTLSMANSGPNTNGSQFFINVVDNTYLNNKHTVFGKVIEGLDIVDKIVGVPTVQNDPRLQNRPVKDVKIVSVTVKE